MRKLFLTLMVLGFISSVLIAEPKKEAAETKDFKEPATGLVFPAKLGGMSREKETIYKNNFLGVSIPYRGQNKIKADIYIYNMGQDYIRFGNSSKPLMQNFEMATKDVFLMAKKGNYQNPVLIDKSVFDIETAEKGKEIPFLRAKLEFTQDNLPRISYIFMSGYDNQFLKIRFTYLKNFAEEGEKTMATFLRDFGKLLTYQDKDKTEKVLEAIKEFDEDPFSKTTGRNMRTIIAFAENSPEVLVVFSPKVMPWFKNGIDKQLQLIFLASYTAGNIQAQIKSSKYENNSYAGLLQVFKTYEKLKDKNPELKIPEIEELITLEKDHKLQDYLKDVPKSESDLKKSPPETISK
jgi:hypothetical protein